MRFGSAVRVSVRAAVAFAALALEDLIRGDRGDRENRKDAAFERRIFFFFREGRD